MSTLASVEDLLKSDLNKEDHGFDPYGDYVLTTPAGIPSKLSEGYKVIIDTIEGPIAEQYVLMYRKPNGGRDAN